MISQIRFCDITNSILWYHKISLILWYHKIEFVISQNRICDITNSCLFCDITNSILWYHKFDFVISQIQVDFVISQIRFCDITKCVNFPSKKWWLPCQKYRSSSFPCKTKMASETCLIRYIWCDTGKVVSLSRTHENSAFKFFAYVSWTLYGEQISCIVSYILHFTTKCHQSTTFKSIKHDPKADYFLSEASVGELPPPKI